MDKALQFLAEILFIYFVQSLLFVYGVHLFSHQRIRWIPLFLCTMISMVFTYFARTILTFGNHTLFSLILLILLSIGILKIPAQEAVKNTLLIAIITFVFEGIVFMLLRLFFGNTQFHNIMENSFLRTLAGIPPNIMLFITFVCVRAFQKRKLTEKGSNEGE